MKISTEISSETLQDALYLYTGLYDPLCGFMTKSEYFSVVDHMIFRDNVVWPLPVTIDVTEEIFKKIQTQNRLYIKYQSKNVGFIEIKDCFIINKNEDVKKVFGTSDINHPGVLKEINRQPYRVGGKVTIDNPTFLNNVLRPEKTKNIFAKKGWKTIIGFQTRNPIHNAHEYLQRVGLELCDGLFINPSMGWKKPGDFTEEAIRIAYNKMIDTFYPKERVYFEGYNSYFRYAGPREAIFHAIIRKNLGCTHFIIGRDHAGIGNYYGRYEAHELARSITSKYSLGINLLLTREPYFCKKCNQIVSDKHCSHVGNDILLISGTNIREMLKNGITPNKKYMRTEIAEELIKLSHNIFH
ncbi:sulfate adenylyltransferase [Bacteroidota bacterium]